MSDSNAPQDRDSHNSEANGNLPDEVAKQLDQEQREPIYVQQLRGKMSRESAEILLAKARRKRTQQDSARGTEDK